MWLPLLGILVGILLGSIFTFAVPVVYAKYLSVAVLAALDSLLGGWRAVLEDKFDSPILITGFFTNILLAAGLAYLGDLLGLDLYLAAVVAFGLRIFSNLGAIRRHFIFQQRRKKAQRQAVREPDPDIVLHQAEVHASMGDILQEDLYQTPQEGQKGQEKTESVEL